MQNKFEEPTPPKRTIKGGWVNVWFKGGGGVALDPNIRDTKASADSYASGDEGRRIACIQIPDFTEGEGL